MHKKQTLRLAAYAAGTAALAGSSAQAAIVYASFNVTLAETSPTALESAATLAAIRFDGTSITLDQSTATPAFLLRSDDNYEGASAKIVEGSRSITGTGYTQTASLLTAGDLVSAGFTAASGIQNFTGSGTDQFVGVSNAAGQLGWVRFSYTTDGASVVVRDAAFESQSGQAITVGAIPEASTAGIAALAGGLIALRRRRKAA